MKMATVVSAWLPEDDLELKNAIERGASLEALAKGAGQFSQRFSLRELRDRWYSLLYDPGVSAQASSHMFELEISKLNRSDINLKVNKIPQKRKSESLCRKYYAMRKKYRSDILNNADLGFFEPNPQFTEHVASDFQKQAVLDVNYLGHVSMLGDNISELVGLQEDELAFLRETFPDTVTDIGGTSGTANFLQAECLNSFEENHTTGRFGNYGFGETMSSLKQGGDQMMVENIRNRENPLSCDSSIISEDPNDSCVRFVDGKIFQLSNPEDVATFQTDLFVSEQPLLRHCRAMQDVSVTAVLVGAEAGDIVEGAQGAFNDTEGKENISPVYTGEFTEPDSLLNVSVGDELLVDFDNAEDKSFISKIEPGSIKDAVLEVVPLLIHGDQQINVHPESNVSVNEVSNSEISEPRAKICCTLNAQDTEIPCNDDIFLLIHPATFCGSAAQPITIASSDASAGAHETNSEQAVIKGSSKGSGCSLKIRTQGLSDPNTIHPFVGLAVKTEPQLPVPGLANKTIVDFSKGRSLCPIPNGSHDRLVEKDVTVFPTRVVCRPTTVIDVTQSSEAGSGRIVHQEFLDECAVFDQEESQIEDEIPCFSDVEAMLHGMDLDPVEHDSQVIQQDPSYQHDESKRTIIRLEQAVRSYSHRAMTSKGAIAFLFGLHLRHYYINKPEVLLGRSTEDIDVDIDLGKEGLANKISRRQAIIKLEEDGSFSLQNLGKNSVYVVPVDGSLRIDTEKVKAVATGQFVTLGPSCLIEIRGIFFEFHINERYVKQQSGKFIDKIRGRTTSRTINREK